MAFLLKRLAQLPLLLLIVSFLGFALVRLAPGGPFDRERSPASPEIKRQLEARYHLDEPIWKQYARYLGALVQGDLGPSLKYRSHSVNDIVAQALPVSMVLGAAAFAISIGAGIPLGIYSAARKRHWTGAFAVFVSSLLVCTPALVLGPLLIVAFAIKLQWLPVGLWESPRHVVLPAAALGLLFAGRVARLMREGMLGVLSSEFIATARAKGAGELAILFGHALRPAVLPVVSYSGPLLADLLTGSFVVENLFQIPGIGVFLVNSALNRDYTMVVGLVVIYAALLILLNLIVDLSYAWLDPRVRHE